MPARRGGDAPSVAGGGVCPHLNEYNAVKQGQASADTYP